jgi:hypothetical protein
VLLLNSFLVAACLQVISPHEVMGLVEVVEHLSTVQDKVYEEATVLVVHNVTGGHRVCIGRMQL